MVYTREQLLKRFKVSCVLGLIISVAMVAVAFSAMGEMTVLTVLTYAGVFVVSAVCYPIIFLGLSFNWKKFLIGYIAPIPILSALIEYVKAMVYGIKAAIAILKKKESVVIGKPVVQDSEE